MLNKKLFVPFFTLASCTLAFAQQFPIQKITLENGLQISVGNCTTLSEPYGISIGCIAEIVNNTPKSVTWNSNTYGDSIRVIITDGTAYTAPISFGTVSSFIIPTNRGAKAYFKISNISSNTPIIPVIQYGSLEFRGVTVGRPDPTRGETYEKSLSDGKSIVSDDKAITATFIGCAKWKQGFKCDISLFYNYDAKHSIIMGFSDFPSIASTDDGRSISANKVMVLNVDNLNASKDISWSPKKLLRARMYFETKSLPRKIIDLQFPIYVTGYDAGSRGLFVFRNIVVK